MRIFRLAISSIQVLVINAVIIIRIDVKPVVVGEEARFGRLHVRAGCESANTREKEKEALGHGLVSLRFQPVRSDVLSPDIPGRRAELMVRIA
jgi:hypothetical protein